MRGTIGAMKIPNSLRLSLRDLFWLLLVVGMGLGWYREYCFAYPLHFIGGPLSNDGWAMRKYDWDGTDGLSYRIFAGNEAYWKEFDVWELPRTTINEIERK